MPDLLIYFLGIATGAGLAFMAESADIDQGRKRLPSRQLWLTGLRIVWLACAVFVIARIWRFTHV